MKKFIVRRDVPGIGAASRQNWTDRAARTNALIAREFGPDLQWVESQIGADRAYCIYYATSAGVVRRHSELAGLPADSIDEITTVVAPSDATDAGEPEKARTRATYDAAADCFDAPPLGFWARAGKRTIDLLDLPRGARVLDVGCGTGASALPAAKRVGPNGHVLGVDLSGALLVLARAKAATEQLDNVEFRVADMTELGMPDEQFDAVVCVFALFFAENMPGLLRELWRMVRPGGRLAVTTWGPRFLGPANGIFWHSVAEEFPDLREPFRPWEQIEDPDSLKTLFEEAGLPAPRLKAVEDRQPLESVEDWWKIVLGSGLRGTIEQIGPDAAARVRHANLRGLAQDCVTAVECNTVHAIATKTACDNSGRLGRTIR